MKIVGVQILPGTDSGIRKSLNLGWYPLVKCTNDLALDDKAIPIMKDAYPEEYYKIDKDLPNISVCAIVGKNGSGKSSLLEIIYRILNNFAATFLQFSMIRNDHIDVMYATGLEARLFFEIGGEMRCLYNHDFVVNYYKIKGNKYKEILPSSDQDTCNKVLEEFFYTISVNYSLYAFNIRDYDPIIPKPYEPLNAGGWLYHMFHKNDGYYIPIVLTPYRKNGEIKINNENNLALQRLSTLSLLFQSQHKSFIEGYTPVEIQYQYIDNYKPKKIEDFRQHIAESQPELIDSIDLLIKHFEYEWKKKILKELNYNLSDNSDPRNETVSFFLAYKSTKICLTYPSFCEMLGLKSILQLQKLDTKDEAKKIKIVSEEALSSWLLVEANRIYAIVEALYKEKSHITMKIHQCINYLGNERYKDDNLHSISYADLIGKVRYKTFDDVFQLLPPAFFMIDLILRKKLRKQKEKFKSKPEIITLRTMSSGERQLLYSMSYIFYHIKNITSVNPDHKRVKYRHINLIFDEAELYYHPEFQRMYVKRLLDNLALCHFDRRTLKSINIIVVTHSPFLLSDIPETNILFLGDEEQKEKQRTFGANIYDLLKSSFFMKSAIGDFAQYKLNGLLSVYYNKVNEKKRKEDFLKKYDDFKFTAEHIADDYLRKTVLFMFHEMQQLYKPDDAKSRLEAELRQKELEVVILRKKLDK